MTVGVLVESPAELRIRRGRAGMIDIRFATALGHTEVLDTMGSGELDAFQDEEAPNLDSRFFSFDTRPEAIRRVAQQLANAAISQPVQSAVKSWLISQRGRAVLAVEAAPPYVDIPWELLAPYFGDEVFIVRLRQKKRSAASARPPGLSVPAKVTAAGWENLPGGGELAGIRTELSDLASLPERVYSVETLTDLPLPDVGRRIGAGAASIVHLAIASGFWYQPQTGEPRTELPLFPDSPGQVFDTELIELLTASPSVRLVIVNTMPNPAGAVVPLLHRICSEVGVAVVGWSGNLPDNIAVDFAKFWYHRATEGMALAEISRTFSEQFGRSQWVSGAVPVVAVPSMRWLTQSILDAGDVQRLREERIAAWPIQPIDDGLASARAPQDAPSRPSPSHEPVTIELELQPSLFPALLINGRPPIKSLSVSSGYDFTGRIEIDCDVGGRHSVHRLTREFKSGPSTIDTSDIQFPAIYDLIAADERRVISFTVSVYADDLVAQHTKSVRWLSRRDWLNDESGWPYVAAYVLPMTSAVAEVVNQAQDILSQIGKPGDRFEGYAKNAAGDSQTVRNQMRAVFQAVRTMGIRYIAPPGLPSHVFNPMRNLPGQTLPPREPRTTGASEGPPVTGQLVRTPADILERSHGTCHDLALLFAAAAEYVSIFPLVILMPGHTYYGYWLSREAHENFWNGEGRGMAGAESRPWTIASRHLTQLIADGAIDVVEPNMAAHSQATFEQALQCASSYSDDVNQVVDVQRSRRWVQPILLT